MIKQTEAVRAAVNHKMSLGWFVAGDLRTVPGFRSVLVRRDVDEEINLKY